MCQENRDLSKVYAYFFYFFFQIWCTYFWCFCINFFLLWLVLVLLRLLLSKIILVVIPEVAILFIMWKLNVFIQPDHKLSVQHTANRDTYLCLFASSGGNKAELFYDQWRSLKGLNLQFNEQFSVLKWQSQI